jgi:hypothetical protein
LTITVLTWAFLGSVVACDSKREEPVLARVAGAAERGDDYRKSYKFDQKVGLLSKKLYLWNQNLSTLVESQATGDRLPVLVNSLELVMPLLKEAQRGFFKRSPNGWQKEILKVEKINPDKEIFLERIVIVLSDDDSWSLTALGRYQKEQSGELFQVQWVSAKNELIITGQKNSDIQFSCAFQISKSAQDMQTATCSNFVVFRLDNKDISIDHLTYDIKSGFNGKGKVTVAKGQQERWEVHSPAVPTVVVKVAQVPPAQLPSAQLPSPEYAPGAEPGPEK